MLKTYLQKLSKTDNVVKLIIIVFAFPAFLININLLPLISDEPTRGIVTLEMIFSGNYINPSITGEPYFNKPPLFNWIQASFVFITNSMEEWVFRMPTILSLLIFSLLLFFYSRKYLGEYAFYVSIGFILSGRILFWDSFMGLIDLTYSLVTFCSFVWIIHFAQKNKLLTLFIGSYLLSAIGFLMKGIPSVAFQGISLLTVFIFYKNIRPLLSIKHIAGITLFLAITGTYYYLFSKDSSFYAAVMTLFDQSNRIQTNDNSHVVWFLHLFEFPINLLTEFAPMTILLFLLLSKEIRLKVFSESIYRILLCLFLSNIILYWISADMRSRYLFMLIPLLIIILIKAYAVGEEYQNKTFTLVRYVILYGSALLALSLFVYPIWHETRSMNNVIPVTLILFLTSAIVWYKAYNLRKLALLSLFVSLLVVRISFNLFNLQARYNSYPDKLYRAGEIQAAKLSMGKALHIFGNTQINHDAAFYITRERKELLTRNHSKTTEETYYLVDEENLNTFAAINNKYTIIYTFTIKLQEKSLYLVKVQNEPT